MKALTRVGLLEALSALDKKLSGQVELLAGGGGALMAAYDLTDSTADLDAIPIRSALSQEELKPLIVEVADELDLPKDWINPYFQSFTGVLPADYASRTVPIYEGQHLRCIALGREDLLIMKLFAGRQKDESHIRALFRMKEIRLGLVEDHLERLVDEGRDDAKKVLDRFDEYKSDFGID